MLCTTGIGCRIGPRTVLDVVATNQYPYKDYNADSLVVQYITNYNGYASFHIPNACAKSSCY
jgi:hypothetical protein